MIAGGARPIALELRCRVLDGPLVRHALQSVGHLTVAGEKRCLV